jgi:hypothetical protein
VSDDLKTYYPMSILRLMGDMILYLQKLTPEQKYEVETMIGDFEEEAMEGSAFKFSIPLKPSTSI